MNRPGQLDQVKAGKHNAADVSFATEMIQHHRQAVEMADGEYGPATKLADAVISAQTAEIEQMNTTLGKS